MDSEQECKLKQEEQLSTIEDVKGAYAWHAKYFKLIKSKRVIIRKKHCSKATLRNYCKRISRLYAPKRYALLTTGSLKIQNLTNAQAKRWIWQELKTCLKLGH